MAYNETTNTITDPNSGFAYTPNAAGLANYQATPTNTAITVDQLQPATAITVPQAPPTVNPLPGATEAATTTTKSLEDYIKANTPAPTALDNQYQGILDSISSLTGADANKSQDQLAGEQAAGLPDLKKQLADINARITMGVAEANKSTASYQDLIAQLENPNNSQQQGVVMNAVIGQQAQVRKAQQADATLKAANLNVLQAYALGMQGNIQAAQESVNRAIDLKYGQIEDQIKVRQAQLDAIQPLLNKQEKAQALALQQKYQDEQQALQEKKQKETNNLNLAVQAGVQTNFVNHNGEFYDSRTGQTFADPASFFKAAGVTSFDEAYKKGLVTDVNGATLADRDFAAQAAAKYPDAGITPRDTQEQVAAKLRNSRIYQRETYIAPSGGSGSGSGIGGSIVTGGEIPPVVSPTLDAAVADIIRSNPGEWGHAADQIDAQFGKGTATKYDSWLKSVYQGGQSIDSIYQPQQIGNLRSIDLSRLSTASNRIVSNYVKSPAYTAVASAVPYIQRLSAAKANPGSISDADLLDSLVKINTGGGQITEAQANLITGGRSVSDTLNVWKKKAQNGGVLSDSQRKQAFDLANQVFKNYQNAYTPIYKQATAQLSQAKIPQSLWTIPDWNTLVGQIPTDQSAAQTYTVNGVTYHLGSDGLYYPQ
jgi:hypothetical protein